MTAAPDGFTLYGDPTGGFSLYCDRCPFQPLETGQQSQALDDLAQRCVEHLKAKHANDPVTVEYVGATPYAGRDDGAVWQYRGGNGNPTVRRLVSATGEELEPWQLVEERTAWMDGADGVVPWRSDVTYANGGTLVHTPTASFRTCSHDWTEHPASPEGRRQTPIRHRCAMSATRDHDWHRCACGGIAPADG